jgi:hypothetical protein
MSSTDFIWTEEQCREAYDDLMIKIAMSSYAGKQGKRLLDENEKLKRTPQFQTTTQAKERIRRTIQKEHFRKTMSRTAKGIYKVASKVAVFFLVFTIAFGTTLVASANAREALYKLVFTYEKRYTLVELDTNTDSAFLDSEIYTWNHAYAPTMMPPGYVVSDVLSTSDSNIVLYTAAGGKYIEFRQSSGTADDDKLRVDTENAQSIDTVYLLDSEGILVSKDGRNTLVWRMGDSMLILSSNESREEIIEIAQAIKLMN